MTEFVRARPGIISIVVERAQRIAADDLGEADRVLLTLAAQVEERDREHNTICEELSLRLMDLEESCNLITNLRTQLADAQARADRVAVLPEITPKEMQALADAIPQEVMKDDREAERVWCASINGWFRSRLSSVPSSRVLKEREVAVSQAEKDLLEEVVMVHRGRCEISGSHSMALERLDAIQSRRKHA